MHISDGNLTKPMTTLCVEHGDRKVLFDVSRLKKPATMSVDRIFDTINGYMATLPMSRQDAIFSIYEKIKDVYNRVYMDSKRQVMLSNLVKELYVQIQLDEIAHYCIHKTQIMIPTSIKERYEDLEISMRKVGDDSYRKRTYLRREYLQLIHMAIALKAMIPIWGEYLGKINTEGVGTTNKEFRCLELLKNTQILRSETISRLREYVEITIPNNKEIMSTILHGKGSVNLPDWLMAIAIVRKICVVEISSADDGANLVGVVHSSILNTIRSMDRKLSGINGHIRSKDKPKGIDEMDENKDIMSIYKIKEKIAVGDLVDGDHYAMDYIDIATRILGREVDPILAEKYIISVSHLKSIGFRPTAEQDRLMRWIISPVISPWSVDNVGYDSLLYIIVACQIVLYYLGANDLVVLMTTTELHDEQGVPIGGIETRSRLDKQYKQRFEETHPYYHLKGGRQAEADNVAHKGVDDLTKAFSRCDWLLNAPNHCEDIVGVPLSHQFIVSTDIKDQLCLVLDHITVRTNDILISERNNDYI